MKECMFHGNDAKACLVYSGTSCCQETLITEEIRKALLDAKSVAMLNTVKARIPECGDFGGIAQNLAYVCQELGIDDEEGENEGKKILPKTGN